MLDGASDKTSPEDITCLFNKISNSLDAITTFVNECNPGSLGCEHIQCAIQPDIDQIVSLLKGVNYSEDFVTSALGFALHAGEAFINDPLIDITNDAWAYGDLQNVRAVTIRGQKHLTSLQKRDPLWNGVSRTTSLVFDPSPPIYSRLNPDGILNIATHDILSIDPCHSSFRDLITMNTHKDNEAIQNKISWLSALLHENFHGLEHMYTLGISGTSVAQDRLLLEHQNAIYGLARALSHDLYAALPRERLARAVQEKFENRVRQP